MQLMFNQLPKLSPAKLSKVKLYDKIFMFHKLQHESCFPEICYTRAAKRPAKIGLLCPSSHLLCTGEVLLSGKVEERERIVQQCPCWILDSKSADISAMMSDFL